jgi:sulfide dehydrogenase [flavocytochrome c] flavoprotein chain
VGMNRNRRAFLRLSANVAGLGFLKQGYAAPKRRNSGAKVVVVGGGFAGSTCALSLRRFNSALDVTLIDPDDHYVTCPMSNSVLVGLRDFESITVSRRGLERAGVKYIRDRVSDIDTQSRRARVGGGAVFAYDRLVMASGIRFLWGKLQGYSEAAARVMPHAWQAGAQTEILSAQLHAMRGGGVVAISVPAGPMRCPPGPFERASLIAGFLKQRNPRAKVLIFDANNHFPKQDLFSDAWRTLYPGMIEWIPVVQDGAILRVEPENMTLYTSQGVHRVDVANIIPPQAPGLPAVQAGLASDHGWCPIKPQTFESTAVAGVHVIGDACIADPMPKAASSANAQAKHCARAIIASLDEHEPPEGHELPPPLLESVCYSRLTEDTALSIHAQYRLAEGVIRQITEPEDPGTVGSQDEARNADDWYARIVHDSFGG